MDLAYVQQVCKDHPDCKDCPLSEINDNQAVCIFNGTPDTWDVYGRNRKKEDE